VDPRDPRRILQGPPSRHHPNRPSAREIGRLTGWREKIFGRRYQAIQISDEPEAQIARLRYVLSHGCKENLVERLRERPGVHCVEALTEGKVLEGWWFDRTQEYLARRRGESFGTYQYATRETLELAPLPCWKHLPPEQRQRLAAAMVSEIEAEAAERRERTGVQALGRAAILAQSQPRHLLQPPAALTAKAAPPPGLHPLAVSVCSLLAWAIRHRPSCSSRSSVAGSSTASITVRQTPRRGQLSGSCRAWRAWRTVLSVHGRSSAPR